MQPPQDLHLLRRVDKGMLVLNMVLLLGVTIVSFPTAFIAEYLGHEGEKFAA